MADQFNYDVFLSHSVKDKPIVRELAERLRNDGLRVWLDEWVLKPGDHVQAKIEEGLEQSRVLVLCMSANAFGSDWAQLEAGTFQFRDPLNRERRFIPLKLDSTEPKGSLAQFLYINWLPEAREQEYEKLLEACRPQRAQSVDELELARARFEEKVRSPGHMGWINSTAFSQDGLRALSGSDDKTVRLWEIESGYCVRIFEGHSSRVWSVVWSSDGLRALSGSEDKTVRLWEVETGRCLRVFEGHTKSVECVALSSDGLHALSASWDKTVRLWEVETGRCLRVFEGHSNSVRSVTFSSDGLRALSGSDDNTVRLWEVETGRCLRVFEGHSDSVWSVVWSSDGLRALSGSEDKTVRLWEVETGRCLRIFEGHSNRVLSVALGSDGLRALSGSDDKTVRLWEVETGRCLRVFGGQLASVRSVDWSSDGLRVLSGSSDKTVRLWEVETGRCLRIFRNQAVRAWDVVWSIDGMHALSGSDDNTVRLWEIETGRCLRIFEGHTESVECVALSSDGLRALSASWDKTVRLWEVETGRCLRVFEGHSNSVRSVTFSSDGLRALSGSEDNTVRLWEVETGRCLRVFEGHSDSVWSVDLSSDGLRALSGSEDKTVRLWEVETGRCLRVFEGHTKSVECVALSSDGLRAISGSEDKTVRLWVIETGRCLRIFEGHTKHVECVALSSDGLRALSGSEDKTVRLWEVETGRCLRVFGGHSESVWSVALSSDGLRAFSGAENGVLRVWDLSEFAPESTATSTAVSPLLAVPDQVQYTNAKVLLVGDSGVGKTGLSNYLALGVKDEERNISTDGAWATHWPLPHIATKSSIDREIWLWDFAGQVDYRLVHQLFMDDTAAAVLVFNPQNENPFQGLGQWDRDLQKASRKPFAKLLVAGRVDRGGLVVSNSSIEKFITERGFLPPLHLTSAKTGEGCDELCACIISAIDWQSIPTTTSPALYRRMKQEILNLRDSGLVLIRLAELKQRMEMVLRKESFDLNQLNTVIDLLAGPGMIKRLDFGGFILLRPEVISRYAAAVVRKVRKHPQELGCIGEDDLLHGELDYQDFVRLPAEDESVVLRTLHETFISRAWCIRQPSDGKTLLVFPSYFRRERPERPGHPNALVTYRFNGHIEDIYATLVVRLHYTEAFEAENWWKDGADFKTQNGQSLGLKLTREAEGSARLDVYFNADVGENSRLIFLRYVHNHLTEHAQDVVRLRHYVCSNKKCDVYNQPFTDQTKIDKAMALGGKGKVFCPDCGKPIQLRDVMEQKFDSPAIKEEARQLQVESQIVIDNESRELILIGHAYSITAEAGQIYRGYTNSDHGIDGEIEFKDDQGRATGKRLYLQLKSGDSYLTKRQRDGAEVFTIKNPRWADYWRQQAYPVLLVIRTSDGEIRWMDVSEYLKRAQQPAKHIVFSGERFDVMSVRRWRDEVLKLHRGT
ncbi:MAG: TIR domain-containing protein [Blastocatellales bacterium]